MVVVRKKTKQKQAMDYYYEKALDSLNDLEEAREKCNLKEFYKSISTFDENIDAMNYVLGDMKGALHDKWKKRLSQTKKSRDSLFKRFNKCICKTDYGAF